MTIEKLMTMNNYFSLKFLALEFIDFWHFQPELMYSVVKLSRCSQAFYFNIYILSVENNNFLEKLLLFKFLVVTCNNHLLSKKQKKWWKLLISTLLLPNCFKYN